MRTTHAHLPTSERDGFESVVRDPCRVRHFRDDEVPRAHVEHMVDLAVCLAAGLLAAAYIFRIIDRSLVSGSESGPSRPLSRWMVWPAFGLALLPVLLGSLSNGPLSLLRIGSPVGALP